MIDTWNDRPEDRPTFEKLVTSLARLCQSTGDLNHHYHILDAPTIPVGERNTAPDAPYHVLEGPTVPGQPPNPETSYSAINDSSSSSFPNEYEIPLSLLNRDSTHGSVGERNTAPDAPYHVLEGPTVPASGSAVNEHPYAVQEGQLSNPETSYSAINYIDSSSSSFPNEYEIPLSLLNRDSTHGSIS